MKFLSKNAKENLRKNIAETEYSCSIGYSCRQDETRSVDDLIRESDEMMYADKAQYYESLKDY